MIYICKAAVLPCQLCSMACSGCGKVCEESCVGCTRACGACRHGFAQGCRSISNAVGNFWAPITRNPLASYVIGTWLAMALVIAATGTSLGRIIGSSDASCDKPKVFCAVDIGLAFLHMVFAFYLQRRLVMAIGEKAAHEMTHKEIADKARHVALYDFGFCIYTFVFIGCFVYNCYTIRDLSGCADMGGAWMGSAGMIVYGVLVWNLGFCWFCTQCCSGQVAEARHLPRATAGGAGAGAGASAA